MIIILSPWYFFYNLKTSHLIASPSCWMFHNLSLFIISLELEIYWIEFDWGAIDSSFHIIISMRNIHIGKL